MNKNWYKDGFKDSNIEVEVDIKIIEKGNILRGIKNEE